MWVICCYFICLVSNIDSYIISNMASRVKGSVIGSVTSQNNKKNLEKSLEEQVYSMEIHNIEAERLRKTFHRICGNTSTSNNADRDPLRNDRDEPNKSAYVLVYTNLVPKIALTKRMSYVY